MVREDAALAACGAPRRVLVVFGTRPEAIKLAPLVKALGHSPYFDVATVVTGQHREMLDPILRLFGIEPTADLAIMSERQTLTDITVRTLDRLSPMVDALRPDALVVQGDTTAALAAALVGAYHQVPVVHLEAGLRSGSVTAPFPEEYNRRLISQLAMLHLAATPVARANLLAEGVADESVTVVGNTVIDALLWAVTLRPPFDDPALESLDDDDRRVLLVTAHRRESWGPAMDTIGRALARLSDEHPNLTIVLPIHRNPVVRQAIIPRVAHKPNVWVREPLQYGAFARLLARSDLLLTDSGGLQEEGPALGKPVLVMRDTTERPEGIAAGAVRLVGTRCEAIVDAVSTLLADEESYRAMARPRLIFGDGHAAERSVAALRHLFGDGPRAEEFVVEPLELEVAR